MESTVNTPYHAKYFASELLRRSASSSTDKLSMSLFDASVDLNPHQIEAAMFAFRSPLSKGVLLADEVGLGKTIEAGLVLCQYWAERKRRLIVVCPASLRKQWSMELEEKFNLPSVIMEAKSFREAVKSGKDNPFQHDGIVITSMNFATSKKEIVRLIPWDLVVIDEAHKLRNAYRPSNKMGQGLKFAFDGRKKLLLTATPLQNSLLELYGLSTIIDDFIFGDLASFRDQYTNSDGDMDMLKRRLAGFCKRTLRSQVLEYIQYTERRPITRPFRPSDREQGLYEAVSAFLQRSDSFAIPSSQRTLTTLIIRKLLASSTQAVAGTLETIKSRLEAIRSGLPVPENLLEELVDEDELADDILDEGEDEQEESSTAAELIPEDETAMNRQKLDEEIAELESAIQWARSITVDTKSRTLCTALEIGFTEMDKMSARRKALIFTESRRTQDYLKGFLEANGYTGRIVIFNGTNSDAESNLIFQQWLADNADTGRISGSRTADKRVALIEYFRDNADIMIATEAAAEGVNLQFCSLVINYDLPWNPQRIEQRIGRCHRYGQKHDVVVINFLNERNDADRRVYELLTEKFNLFNGVFGASDEVLGTIESGVDFERRILNIYQSCRSSEEIEVAFRALQEEMEQSIASRMLETRKTLLDNFDEDVHSRLKVQLDKTQHQLDRFSKLFWSVTRFMLADNAAFDDEDLSFDLQKPPVAVTPAGRYHLISKTRENVEGSFLYRLSHPLGEYVLNKARELPTPEAELAFDISHHPLKVSIVEALKGQKGHLTLSRLTISSFDTEEHLLFSALTDTGETLDQEQCEKLFQCRAIVSPLAARGSIKDLLQGEAERHAAATISRSLEENNRLFQDERDKLEKWADDLVLAAEKELRDIKAKIKLLNRQARQAATTAEQHELQKLIVEQEKKQRRQRQRIFEVEDDIIDKRDGLITKLEKQMTQRTKRQELFTIRWAVV